MFDGYFWIDDEEDKEYGTKVTVRMKDGNSYDEEFIGGLITREDKKFGFEKICCDYELDINFIKEVEYTDFGVVFDTAGTKKEWAEGEPQVSPVYSMWGNNYLSGITQLVNNFKKKVTIIPTDEEDDYYLAMISDDDNQYDPSEPQSWGPSDHYDYC